MRVALDQHLTAAAVQPQNAPPLGWFDCMVWLGLVPGRPSVAPSLAPAPAARQDGATETDGGITDVAMADYLPAHACRMM